MMRLILFLLLSLLALPASAKCAGQNLFDIMSADERAALDVTITAHPYPSGNLWRAQKGDSIIHIMGTMQLSNTRLTSYLEPLWPVVDAADLILLEATQDTMEQLETAMLTDPSLMFVTDGPTLPERLSDKDWTHLSQEMSARGVPAFLVSKMQPWFVFIMLAIPPCAMAGTGPQDGVSFRIMNRADDQNIPTRALETYDIVLSLFGGKSNQDEINMIHMALAGAQNADDMITTTVEAYFAGEHRAIWELNRIQANKTGGFN